MSQGAFREPGSCTVISSSNVQGPDDDSVRQDAAFRYEDGRSSRAMICRARAIDHQSVAVPATDRMAQPGRDRIARIAAPVEENLARQLGSLGKHHQECWTLNHSLSNGE